MNSYQIQDIRLLYESVYNEELREKANEYNNTVFNDNINEAETVKSSGGAGGQVTADKQYPATLRGLKGVKSTDAQGGEYFQPYTSSGRKEPSGKPFEPTTMPDPSRAQYKNTYTNTYKPIPASQSTQNPQSHISRTGVPRVRRDTRTYGIPEQVDLFDYLLEYLVVEGYADTNQDALVIMANMSKEEIDSLILERRREDKGKPKKPRNRAVEFVRSQNKGIMTRSGRTISQHEEERGVPEKDRPKKQEETTADRLAVKKQKQAAAVSAREREAREEDRRRRLG